MPWSSARRAWPGQNVRDDVSFEGCRTVRTRVRLAPGSRLGPYEILDLLGAGGMGEVYRGRDPRLNRDVAIKVLPADWHIDSLPEAHARQCRPEPDRELQVRKSRVARCHARHHLPSFRVLPGRREARCRRMPAFPGFRRPAAMRTLLLPFLLVALGMSNAATAPAAGAGDDLTATVTAMARIGRTYGATFSPDGSRLAVISDLNGSPQLWVVPTGGGWPTLVTTGQDPVGAAEWSPAGDWLAFTVLPGGGLNSQVYVVRPDGTGLRRLTDGGKENNWLSRWTWDGRQIVISSNRRDPASMDSWLIDVARGTFREIARNPGIGSVTSISADGQRMLLSRLRSRGDDNLYLLDLEKGADILLTEHKPPALFEGEISPGGRTVYISSNKDRDLFAFYRIPIGADGKPGAWELLAERADAELDGFSVDDRETLASLTWNVAGRTELELLDLRTRARTPVALPSELSGAGRFSRDGTKLALTVSGSTRPPDVWVMDVASRALHQVTRTSHAGVDLDELIKPELVHFTAHDGLPLSGWLYRPKNGRGPGPYVLSFHGGPEGQEVPAFRADYQALLSQGIGVFAPNVRGSSGFGKASSISTTGRCA